MPACPAGGHARRFLKLQGERLAELEAVESSSRVTVRQPPKNDLKPRRRKYRRIPPKVYADFVRAIDDMPDACSRDSREGTVPICLDGNAEAADEGGAQAAARIGQLAGYGSGRSGTTSLFMPRTPLAA